MIFVGDVMIFNKENEEGNAGILKDLELLFNSSSQKINLSKSRCMKNPSNIHFNVPHQFFLDQG